MRLRIPFVLVGAIAAALALASCTGAGNGEQDTVSAPATEPASTATGSATAGASSAAPSSSPETAAARKTFDDTNRGVASGNANADDKVIVAALVGAGFDVHAMQITPDTTSIGRRADSIQVSVLVGSTCLLGQFRGTTYVGDSAPVLSTGRCLIGSTRAIDWAQ